MTDTGGPGAVTEGRGERIGTVVCGWTIERHLGAGVVCDSWLGAKKGDGDAVVRILREPFARDERARTDWLGASWAANRFYHPRVPKVMQDGKDDAGAAVVVRRWAKGRPLEQMVRGGSVDLATALRLAEQLLDALEMAHAHGIVHGALTPSNVIVTSRGSARLVDFATAPGLLSRPGDSLAEARAKAAEFVAPERRGPVLLAATEQSDVWSVGACLHYALAGTPPGEAPSLARSAPDAQGDLASVVDRALAADPLDRYESAYAMLGDIRCLMAGRKPRLQAAMAPVPSQGAVEPLGLPQSASGLLSLDPPTETEFAAAMAAERGAPTVRRRGGEWRGNVVLIAAIAFIVAFATFVLVRERLADEPPRDPGAPVGAPEANH